MPTSSASRPSASAPVNSLAPVSGSSASATSPSKPKASGTPKKTPIAFQHDRGQRPRVVRIPEDPQPARGRAGGQQLGEPDRPVDAEPAAPVRLRPEAGASELHAEAVEVERERLLEVEPAAGDRDAPLGVDAERLDPDLRPSEPAHGRREDAAEHQRGSPIVHAQPQGGEAERPESGDVEVDGRAEGDLQTAVAAQAHRDVDRPVEERDLQRAADRASGHRVLDQRHPERPQREAEPGQRPGQLEALQRRRRGDAAAAEERVVDRQRRLVERRELDHHVVQVQPGEVRRRAGGEVLAPRREPAHAPGRDDDAGLADHAARQRGRRSELDLDRAPGGEPQGDAPEREVEPVRRGVRLRGTRQDGPEDRAVDPQDDGDVEQRQRHGEPAGPGLEGQLGLDDGELAPERQDERVAERPQRDLLRQHEDDPAQVAVLDRLEGGVGEQRVVEQRGDVTVELHHVAGDVGEQRRERRELPAFEVGECGHRQTLASSCHWVTARRWSVL